MNKVKCNLCFNSDGKKCKVKKTKVAQNKKRFCAFYEKDTNKEKVKAILPSEYVPHHMVSRKNYKKWVTEQKKKELKESMEEKVDALSNPDVLSRFRSSATKV